MESLAQLEVLCERLYNSQDSEERANAERTLKCFSVSTEYISQCQYILDNASTPYALMLASSSLLKQVTERKLPLQLLIDIRNYLIKYLATKGPELEPFVIGSLVQLLCRVSKFGWFDDAKFRDIIEESLGFLSQATHHYAISLKILKQLVSEMNEPNPAIPSSYNRKVACSFKANCLYQIFQISLSSLRRLKEDGAIKLQELALSLALGCLSFDYMGISPDESSDEIGTVQFPASWKPFFEDAATFQIFFDYYATTKPPVSKEALECLTRLVSARRSLFTHETARLKFLSHLMAGTKEILQSGSGLSYHDNYHEFCRLLGRFKVKYQLSELVNVEGYSDWIHLVAEFTLKSLQSWQWAGSSIYYLLGFWSRLVTSVKYTKGEKPNDLEDLVPKIVEGFLSSKFDSFLTDSLDDISEDPLDNVEVLQDQLDSFPYLCRFQYESCSIYILKIMQPLLQTYVEAANFQNHVNKGELCTIEAKLAWIVHIIAAILKIKVITGFSGESQEIIDAELAARVLQLVNVTDNGFHGQRYAERSKQRLDCAILTFFQHFRKSYVGDQAMHSSKQLYARLSELLGLHDHVLLLNVIAGKIATNLKFYTENCEVINLSLNLFLQMASGYSTGKILLKLDPVQFIISNQNRSSFPFLEDYRHSRSRTAFYYTIGVVIFLEDSPPKFNASMNSLLQVIRNLELTPDSLFRSEKVKLGLVGLMRDLRGIAMATNSRRTYSFLFDWFYPHMPLLLRAISLLIDTPEVINPLLKFVAEFVMNKSQRLSCDISSLNGILLFREVSKLIVTYGSRILSIPNNADMYTNKYKGIWISLTILSRALSGNYINFGVFQLYGDRALSDALDSTLKMILSIPLTDILLYRKLKGAYYGFLEVLMNHQIAFITSLDTSTFAHLIRSLELGFRSLDSNISSQCTSTMDTLATFYFNHILMGESPNSEAALSLARHHAECSVLFTEILKTLFEIILFEDRSAWTLSKPMLSLILINEEMFPNIKAQLLASQLVNEQECLSTCFDKLMVGINRSLDQKNRDKFTQNLVRLKNEWRSKELASV